MDKETDKAAQNNDTELQPGEQNTGTATTTPPSEGTQPQNVENQQGEQNSNSTQAGTEQGAQVDNKRKTTTPKKEGANSENSELKRIAKEVFRGCPGKKVLYFTTDKIPFFDKNDAVKHSFSLKEKDVIEIKN